MTLLQRTALAALLAAAPAAAFGQPPPGYPVAPPPVHVPQPPNQTSANAGVALPPAAMAAPQSTTYVPNYVNNWGYPNYLGPVGGALSGYADVVNAYGQFQIQNQQSRLIQTQADMSRLGLRTAQIQQQQYEQSLTPSTLEGRQQADWRRLQSALNNPPNPEIWSGEALNSLFTALQGAQRQGLHADPVPLESAVLQHINLTTGQNTTAQGAGMLKDLTNLNWPFAMQDAPWVSSAATINDLAQKAADEIKGKGRVTAATFKSLNDAVAVMTDAVRNNQDLSPTDYIESKGFLDELRTSIQGLRDPNVAMYLNGTFAAKGPTVADLVAQMTSQGLRFAPATQADQPAYTVLYQAMLSYDYRLSQLAAR
jgi:hypothetical protein